MVVLLDARTILRVTRAGLFLVAGSAGRGKDTSDDFALAFENSLVAGDAANALGDVDVAVAAARCGENSLTINCWNSRIRCWRPLLSGLLVDLCQFS